MARSSGLDMTPNHELKRLWRDPSSVISIWMQAYPSVKSDDTRLGGELIRLALDLKRERDRGTRREMILVYLTSLPGVLVGAFLMVEQDSVRIPFTGEVFPVNFVSGGVQCASWLAESC
jgi:hypothetical protein